MSDHKITWLVSYPKSGNTWMRILLGNVLLRKDISNDDDFSAVGTISSAREPFDDLMGLNSSDMTDDEVDLLRPVFYRQFTKEAKKPPFVKTHDCYHKNAEGNCLFPGDVTHKAIYIVRNPLDVSISFAYHMGHGDFAKSTAKMNDPDAILSGSGKRQLRQIMGSWSHHVKSWTQQTDIPVMLVRYEDMLADTALQLRRVIDFLELEIADKKKAIQNAVELSRFENLQKIEKAGIFKERPPKSKQFFRSGRSGEGAERLTKTLKTELIACQYDMMAQLGYLEKEEVE